jgi:hypothetical protein
MLNYQSADRFFEHCLVECGLLDGWSQHATLSQFKEDEKACAALIKTLQDVRLGADLTFRKGKPNESGAGLDFEEWERRWSAWAASRKAAFYSRAALFLLGDNSYFGYFIDTLRSSHNLVFLGASSDVLQHATGRYLNGPEEDLTKSQLADWWEKHRPLN